MARATANRRRRSGLWLRAAAVLLGGALGLSLALVALAFGLSHGMAREPLRAWVERELRDALGESVVLAALEGPLYPELTLRGLEIGDAGDPWFGAETVQIECAQLCGAPSGELVLRALTLRGLRLRLDPDPEADLPPGTRALPDAAPEPEASPSGGAATAPGASPPDEPLLPFALRIAAIELEDSRIALPLGTWLGWAENESRPGATATASPTLLRAAGTARDARVDGRGVHLPGALELRLEARDAPLGERRISRAHGRLVRSDSGLRVDPLEIETDAGVLRSAELELDFSAAEDDPQPPVFGTPRAVELRADLESLDAAAWTETPGLHSALSGALELRARPGRAGWNVPLATIRAELRGEPDSGLPLDTVELDVALEDSRWQLRRTRLRGAALDLEASGAGDLEGVHRLTITGAVHSVDALRPPALAPWIGGGAARLQASASGRWSQLNGSVELSANALRLGAGDAGRLRARLRASAGVIEIRELTYASGPRDAAAGPGEQLRAEGHLELEGAGELALSLDALDLARIPAEALGDRGSLRGRLTGRIALRGALDAPQLDADLETGSVALGPFRMAEAELRLRTAGALAEGALGGTAADGTTLAAEFALPYAGRWPQDPLEPFRDPRARVDLRAQVRDLAALAHWGELDLGGATGAAELDARIAGSAAGPRISGQTRLRELRVPSGLPGERSVSGTIQFEQRSDWNPVGPLVDLSATLELSEGEPAQRWPVELRAAVHHWLDWPRFSAELQHFEARHEAQRVHVEGAIRSLRAEALHVRVQALDLADWIDPEVLELGGRVDAQIELQGELLGRPQLAGALAIEAPRYREARAERLSLEFGTERERFVATGQLQALGSVAARLRIDLPGIPGTTSWDALLADPTSQLTLQSEKLEIAWLRPLLPPWLRDPRGSLSTSLRARGGPELELEGELAIEDADGQVDLLGQRMGPLDARAHLEPGRLVLDRFELRGRGSEGVARARGEIALQGFAPHALSMRAELDRFPLSRSRAARFDLGGALELSGVLEALVFSGDLRVERGSFAAIEESDPVWREIQVLQTSAAPGTQIREGAASDPLIEQARGSLRIVIPPNTWVRGRGAELEVTGEVELSKRSGEPMRYAGQVETLRGRYQLGRRALDVERGTLLWPGTEQLDDPQLDVLASAQLPEHRVEVQITGPLSNYQLVPRSIPDLPREDVLALLLFGRPTASLEQDRAAALSSVLAVLGTEFGGNDLRSRLSRALPFDTLSVESDDEGTGTRVEVGRYVGGVFVRYGRSVTGSETPDDEVQLEWRLTPELSVRSETSAAGHSGADLIWRLDY